LFDKKATQHLKRLLMKSVTAYRSNNELERGYELERGKSAVWLKQR